MIPRLVLRLVAPYVAVLVLWVGLENAWLAILAYHAQILLWNRRGVFARRQFDRRSVVLGLGMLGAGLAVYFILPYVVTAEVGDWLGRYGLSGWSLALMVPYFGILHPWLEQAHWKSLRARTSVSHVLFAGYHVIVLSALLPVAWLVVTGLLLTSVSMMWRWMDQRQNGAAMALASHMGADLGIVLAAWFLVTGG